MLDGGTHLVATLTHQTPISPRMKGNHTLLTALQPSQTVTTPLEIRKTTQG
jgi:hypothetical protein